MRLESFFVMLSVATFPSSLAKLKILWRDKRASLFGRAVSDVYKIDTWVIKFEGPSIGATTVGPTTRFIMLTHYYNIQHDDTQHNGKISTLSIIFFVILSATILLSC
jgi:hypothetical protein